MGIPLADCEQALAAVNEAITQEPTNAFAYLLRAIAFRKRGDYAAALAEYARLNLPLELSVAGLMGSSEAELKIEDRVVGKVEGMERLIVTKVDGDLVWVESVAPFMGRAAVDDKRQGWLDKRFVQPEIRERAKETDWYTSRRAADMLTERMIGRERLKPVDAQDLKALDALQQARDLLGETGSGGFVYLRRDLKADELERILGLCNQALEIEPENRSAILLRGLTYREQKDYAAALADYQRPEEPFTLVLRRRSVELKQPRKSTGTARMGDTLAITQVNADWLWVASVNGDKTQTGWLGKKVLEQEETYTTRAFRATSGGSSRVNTNIRNTIRNEAINRARGYIPYGGWLPF